MNIKTAPNHKFKFVGTIVFWQIDVRHTVSVETLVCCIPLIIDSKPIMFKKNFARSLNLKEKICI